MYVAFTSLIKKLHQAGSPQNFLFQLDLLLLLLFFSCPAMKAPLSLWHCPAFPLSVCLSVSLPLVRSLSERWHWETAVTWDASRSWQGLRKPRQKGGRGPLSETGGADLPHSPSLFLLHSLPVPTSASISYPPPINRSQRCTLKKVTPNPVNEIACCDCLQHLQLHVVVVTRMRLMLSTVQRM